MLSQRIRRVSKAVLILLLSAMLGSNLYLILAKAVFKNDLPKICGFAQVVVVSGSMQPDIKVGDMLIIQRQSEYNIDDIVTYRSGGDLVTHRIIDISGSEVTAKGASNNVPDQPFQLSDIEGKMILRIPMAGNAIFFLKSPLGILLATILLLLMLELPHVFEKRKLIKIGMSA